MDCGAHMPHCTRQRVRTLRGGRGSYLTNCSSLQNYRRKLQHYLYYYHSGVILSTAPSELLLLPKQQLLSTQQHYQHSTYETFETQCIQASRGCQGNSGDLQGILRFFMHGLLFFFLLKNHWIFSLARFFSLTMSKIPHSQLPVSSRFSNQPHPHQPSNSQ